MLILATNIGVLDSIVYSLLGFAIVFAALIALWAIIAIMARTMDKTADSANEVPQAASSDTPAPEARGQIAPGSAGKLVLKNVSEKNAAIIMAIVANKLKKPLNELRFKSITEVENDEI